MGAGGGSMCDSYFMCITHDICEKGLNKKEEEMALFERSSKDDCIGVERAFICTNLATIK